MIKLLFVIGIILFVIGFVIAFLKTKWQIKVPVFRGEETTILEIILFSIVVGGIFAFIPVLIAICIILEPILK